MWRALSASLWLSSTAALAAGVQSPGSPAVESARNFAVWNQPLTLLTTPLGYTGVSLGANLPLGRSHDLILELMPFWADSECDSDSDCDAEGAFAAVGVAFKLFGPREDSRDGFFVQPKFVAHFARHHRVDAFPPGSSSSNEFSVAVGIDIGYRMTFGHFFIAPVLGASIGYDNDLNDAALRFFPLATLGPNEGPLGSPVIGFDLNIHLLRIGVAF